MARNVTVDAGATTGGSFSGTNPQTFVPNADNATVDAAAIAAFLNAGTSVRLETGTDGTQAGQITVSNAINKTSGGAATLTLEAAHTIVVNQLIQADLGMRAVDSINLITSASGFGTVAASVTGAGGNVVIDSGGLMTIGTVGDVTGISAAGGSVSVAADRVTINAAVNTTGTSSTSITANGASVASVGVFADVGNLNSFTSITANDSIVGTGTIRGSSVNLSALDGIGVDATGFVRTAAELLSADNTATNTVAVVEADDVTLGFQFRNQVASSALSLRTLNGSLNTALAIVTSNNGQITLTAGDTGAGAVMLTVGFGDITSGGGDIRLFSADAIQLVGDVSAGSGNVTIEANSASATESVADNSGEISGVFGTVSGNVVTFKGASGIGSTPLAVSTAASTIAATNTVSGDIVIVEADGASFSATNVGLGAISLTTTSGMLTIGAATGAGSGAITLAGAGGINVNAAVTTGSTLALNSSGATAINVVLSNLGGLQTDASGTTTISSGSVTTSGAQTYNDAVTLGAAAALTSTVDGITFAGTVDAAFDLAVSTAGAGSFSGAISGAGKFTHSGSGTTTLAANNLYTGATTLNGGTLLVNGSIVSATTVNGTATLGGTGTVGAVTVASGGTLSAGASASAGMLSTGNVNLSGGATYKVELGGIAAGSQYDLLNVTGSVTLSGATLDIRFIDAFFPISRDSFIIIANDGADSVNGTFAGLAEGATFAANGRPFSITYHGGSNNNDVVLQAGPTIVSNGGGDTANVSVAENTTAVTFVQALFSSGSAPAFSIVGGADASKFQFDRFNGTFSFITPPDFDHPADADHDNSYVVQVRASEGGVFDDQILTVNVTDVSEHKRSNDFNGDGNSDVLWRHANGLVAEWQMNGDQIILNAGVALPGNEWTFQDTGDFGNDGKSDVMWRHPTGQVVLWQMDGNQIVSNTSILEVSNQYHVQGVADFNGDGKSDVLFRHDSGQVVLWQMDGDQIVGNTAISTPSREYHIEGVGDFGGDDRSDVLLRHDNGQVVMWQMDGDRIAVNTAVANVSQQYQVQGVGDFNGDGNSDVVWRHDSGQFVLWQMNGDQIMSNTAILDVSNSYKVQDVRDYNGDGMSDILLRHDSGQVVLWQMNGDKIAANTAVTTLATDWMIQSHHFDLV